MDTRTPPADERAVSPVIGVILMVAITVILAAVIATFVLGLGEQVSSVAPTTSFGFNYDEGEHTGDSDPVGDGRLTITHVGGDSVAAGNLYIRGTVNGNDDGAWSGPNIDSSYGADSRIRAGMSISVDVASDDIVRVVYEAEGGGDSAVLERFTGPDA